MIFRLIILLNRMRERKNAGLLAVFLIVLFAVLGNATTFYVFDRATHPGLTYSDALWYSLVSLTTVGYGDYFAISTGARVGTFIFIMLIGLSTFTVLIGMTIDWFWEAIMKGQRGLGTIDEKEHIVIVNFPGVARVTRLVEEFRSDPKNSKRKIVIVSDQIERIPASLTHVEFIHGSPLQPDTLERANIAEAGMCLVLSPSYNEPNSDALVAAICGVVDRMNPSIHIVSECLDEKHRMLFEVVRCDAIVPVLKIGGNLLVQEMNDPGITKLVDMVTSNLKGSTLYSTTVGGEIPGCTTYRDLAKVFLDNDTNLVGVNRGDECVTSFCQLAPESQDTLIYTGMDRLTWDEVTEICR